MTPNSANANAKEQRSALLSGKEKPKKVEIDLCGIPEELKDIDRWVCWQWILKNGKWTKPPIQTTGQPASSTNNKTWTDFGAVVEAYDSDPSVAGIGFMLGDGWSGVDYDGCYDPATKECDSAITTIVKRIGSYTEISPSGFGLKTLVRGKKPKGRSKCDQPDVECYHDGRYFTITGHCFGGEPQPITDGEDSLKWLQETYLDRKPTNGSSNGSTRPSSRDSEQVEAARLAMMKVTVSPDENDGSGRLLKYARQAVRWDLDDAQAIAVIRYVLSSFPTPSEWSDDEIKSRLGDTDAVRGGALTGRVEFVLGSGKTSSQESGKDDQQDGAEWTEPISLDDRVLDPFPVQSLPGPLRQWASEEATSTQTPIDMAAMLSLSVVAGAVAKKFDIQPWQGWSEPLNIYVAVILDPANRKSSVYADALKPLEQYQDELCESVRESVAEEQSKYRMAQNRLRKLEKQAAELKSSVAREQAADEARAQAKLLSDWVCPSMPVLSTSDSTSEQLGVLLSENDERIAVFSAEGGIFELMSGKYAKGGSDFEVYLKGHSGDSITVDRMSRARIRIRQPAITMGLAIQPNVLQSLAEKKEFRGRGLLARFLYAIPSSLIGDRSTRPEQMAPETQNSYHSVISSLCRHRPDAFSDTGEVPHLQLGAEAAGTFEAFCQWVERQLGSGCLEYMHDWGGKLCGATLRLAGVIHCVEHHDGDPLSVGVSEASVVAAINIGKWSISHADQALGLLDASDDEAIDDARYVLRWIRRSGDLVFTLREARRHGQRRFNNDQDRLDNALRVLESREYVRKRRVSLPGGKVEYDVTPFFNS